MSEKEKKEDFGYKLLRTICISSGVWLISTGNSIYINKNIGLEYLIVILFGIFFIGVGLYAK